METRIKLPCSPCDKVNELLDGTDSPPVVFPKFTGQLKHSWASPTSHVSKAVVPNYNQNGSENYIQAYIVYSERDDVIEKATHDAFVALVDLSIEQALDRAGDGANRLDSHDKTCIMQTAACEVVKRIWTTAHIEQGVANHLGELDRPDSFDEAVSRERDSIDIRLTDGREFQVKSVCGSRDGVATHVWHGAFEDYFTDDSVKVATEKWVVES
jgi:hypothetical protein